MALTQVTTSPCGPLRLLDLKFSPGCILGPQALPAFPPMFPGGDTWMSRKWGILGLDPAESKAHSVASMFVFVFPLESLETRTDLTFPQVQ